MKYKYKYKSSFDRKTVKEYILYMFSRIVIYLYNQNWFKKLQLNSNGMINSHISYAHDNFFDVDIKGKNVVNVFSVTLLDSVEILNSSQLYKGLYRIASNFRKGHSLKEVAENLRKAFKEDYPKSGSYTFSKLMYFQTKNIKELDLIDSVSISITKGMDSYFLINYTITPSELFKSLFAATLSSNDHKEETLNFYSINRMLKKKAIYSGITTKFYFGDYSTSKIFNELSYQFKQNIIKEIELGDFYKSKKFLLPRIIIYQYNKEEYKDQVKRLIDTKLGLNSFESYNFESLFLNFKMPDLTKAPAANFNFFYPYNYVPANEFAAIEISSAEYIKALSPLWFVINSVEKNESTILYLRRQILKSFKKNKVSLFLKSTINLLTNINLHKTTFDLLTKQDDLTLFKRTFQFFDFPKFKAESRRRNVSETDFIENFYSAANNVITNTKKSYSELKEIHTEIINVHSLRANMKLQRLLFIIAVLGVILSVYGANSQWFNSQFLEFTDFLKLKI